MLAFPDSVERVRNVVTMLFGSNQVLIKTLETDDATGDAMDSFLLLGRVSGQGSDLGSVDSVGRVGWSSDFDR